MNSSYQGSVFGKAEVMLEDNDKINETSLGQIPTVGNATITREIENFNVSSYLAQILGPQRQPNEKVYNICLLIPIVN